MDQLITIELFGQPYTFKADSDTAAASKAADALVREVVKVEDQQTGFSSHSTKLTIMILAALNIASEKHELQNKYSEMKDKISEHTQRLARLLDTGLQG